MTYIKTKLTHEIVIDSIITVHYFEYMKDFEFKGESHDFWEFLYVDKGTVSVRSDDHWITLNTGDIIFHKPNEFHAIHSIGKSSPNLVAMSFTSASPAIHFFENKSGTLTKEERALISMLIQEAKAAFSTPIHIPSVEQVLLKADAPFASQQLIQLYLELFLIMYYRKHTDSTLERIPVTSDAPEMETSKLTRFQEILQYMEFRICEQLSVSDICNALSISRSALQSLFHEKAGCGAIDYFNNMKIQRAKEIIRDGTMNFTEIAYFLSYSSLPYFSKQFKKNTGMSPLEYSSSIKSITRALKDGTSKDNRESR